jgi:hypothetical protein
MNLLRPGVAEPENLTNFNGLYPPQRAKVFARGENDCGNRMITGFGHCNEATADSSIVVFCNG